MIMSLSEGATEAPSRQDLGSILKLGAQRQWSRATLGRRRHASDWGSRPSINTHAACCLSTHRAIVRAETRRTTASDGRGSGIK